MTSYYVDNQIGKKKKNQIKDMNNTPVKSCNSLSQKMYPSLYSLYKITIYIIVIMIDTHCCIIRKNAIHVVSSELKDHLAPRQRCILQSADNLSHIPSKLCIFWMVSSNDFANFTLLIGMRRFNL